MANKLGSLLIQLGADTALLQKDMGRAVGIMDRGAKQMSSAVSSVNRALGGIVSFIAIKRGIETIITASAESEAAMRQLEARIKSTGGAAGLTAAQIAESSKAFEKASTFDDEAILSAQTRLLQFGTIAGQTFFDATQAVLDLSVALDKDLNESALLVGKAFSDPAKGIRLLTKAGVTFTEQQKAQINQMAEVGDRLGQQKILLEALTTATGGAAKAARDTLGGALKSLENTLQDLIENDSASLPALTKAINSFNDSLSDPAAKRTIDEFTSAIIDGLSWVVENGPSVAANLESIGTSIVNLGKAFIVFKAAAFGGARGGPIGAVLLGSLAAMELFQGEVGRFLADPRLKKLQDLADESTNAKNDRLRASLGIPEGGLKGPGGLQVSIGAPAPKGKSITNVPPVDDAAIKAAASAEKTRLESIKSIIDGLKEQQATLGKGESALVAYKLQVLGATKAQVDFAVSLSQANAIQEIIDALEKEGATLGLTGAALTAYQLSVNGASQSQIEFATAIARSNIAKQNDLDILEKEKTAREELNDKIKKIRDEAITGMMDEVTAIRIAEGLKVEAVIQGVDARLITEQKAADIIALIHKKAAKDVEEALKKNTDAISEFTLEAARKIQNALGDQIFNILQGKFENIGDTFKATLDRMVADALAAQLAQKLFGDFDKTSKIGGWIGSLLGMFGGGGGSAASIFPGFANGAPFSKGNVIPFASGGIVSSPTLFPMARGTGLMGEAGPEAVMPLKRLPNGKLGVQADGGGRGVVLNINISGVQDARGIREAGNHAAARVGSALQAAMQRNS